MWNGSDGAEEDSARPPPKRSRAISDSVSYTSSGADLTVAREPRWAPEVRRRSVTLDLEYRIITFELESALRRQVGLVSGITESRLRGSDSQQPDHQEAAEQVSSPGTAGHCRALPGTAEC
jgi:hypothetical protein